MAAFEAEASWLGDFAEFMSLKEHFQNKALQEWDDRAIVKREEAALHHYRELLAKRLPIIKSVNTSFTNNGQP